MLWFTSDEHFGHSRIIQLTERPFVDLAEMHQVLVANWNLRVAPGDDVIVLGDWVLPSWALAITGELHGRLTLLPGNHDACWTGHHRASRARAARRRYLDAGFVDVIDEDISLQLVDTWVTCGHFPFRGDSTELERYPEHRPADTGGWRLNGHVHGAWRQRGRQINVGIDAWAGAPVPVTTINEMITAGPQDLAPLEWSTMGRCA